MRCCDDVAWWRNARESLEPPEPLEPLEPPLPLTCMVPAHLLHSEGEGEDEDERRQEADERSRMGDAELEERCREQRGWEAHSTAGTPC